MKKRANVLEGKTHKIIVPDCVNLYATLNKEEGELCEVMLNVGKKGSCQNTCFYLVGVMLSIMLELGVTKDKLAKTMKKHFLGVTCTAGKSCFDQLGSLIINEIEKEKAKA